MFFYVFLWGMDYCWIFPPYDDKFLTARSPRVCVVFVPCFSRRLKVWCMWGHNGTKMAVPNVRSLVT